MLRLSDPYYFGKSSVWRFFLTRSFIYIGFVTDRKGFPCTPLVLLVRTVNSLRVTFRILYWNTQPLKPSKRLKQKQATLTGEPLAMITPHLFHRPVE